MIEQENSGRARAVNRAMARVRGDYLWIFDDDDIAVPQSLERHLAVLEAHPEVDFTYAGCVIIQSHPDGRVEHKGPLPMPDVPEDEMFSRMLEQNFMQLQAMLVRTRCYREIGLFDPRLNLCDDYDINLRLTRRFAGRRLDAPSFLFRQHGGLRGRPGALFPAEHRSRYWVKENRDIHLRLRGELELGEYLPRSLGAGELDAPRRRRALLQRACVMARLASLGGSPDRPAAGSRRDDAGCAAQHGGAGPLPPGLGKIHPVRPGDRRPRRRPGCCRPVQAHP